MKKKVDTMFEEQETIINYPRLDELAEVYTTDKNVMKRYEKFSVKHPDLCKLIREDKYSMTFHIVPKCASIYPRAPRQSNMTDEQKEEVRLRMKTLRQKQLGI